MQFSLDPAASNFALLRSWVYVGVRHHACYNRPAITWVLKNEDVFKFVRSKKGHMQRDFPAAHGEVNIKQHIIRLRRTRSNY
jgi:hypothetical protein